ncbi:MAG: protein-disulfide reductase DsbD domain-containing protein [Acidobacteriota bacterium]
MKLRITLALLVLIGCLSATAAAQGSEKVVRAKAGQSPYRIKPGVAAPVEVIIDIDAGYHINSNRPAEEFLIGTSLKLEKLAGVTATRVVYPKAKIQKFQFSEKPLSVYDGRVVLKFTARAAAAGLYTLKGKLTVQACNDEACLRPATIDVDIPIEVAK